MGKRPVQKGYADDANLFKMPLEMDLDGALDILGVGKYQIFHCTMMALTLSSALLEMIGIAFILPAANCDLTIPDHMKGVIASIPNIGIILTAPIWGQAADRWGRKPVLCVTTAGAGLLGLAASFADTLVWFAVCKLGASLFLSGPTSLSFAYLGELLPAKRRDMAMSICNGFLTLSATFSSLFAWAILSKEWQATSYKAWQLLTVVHALPLVFTVLLLVLLFESPKFLMSRGKREKALGVLSKIYAYNNGSPSKSYPVTSLKPSFEYNISNQSAFDLFHQPHFKWLIILGILIFGLFSTLNGLYIFAPDIINKLMKNDEDSICSALVNGNQTLNSSCMTFSSDMFLITITSTMVVGVAVMVFGFCPVSKRTTLVAMYGAVGVFCLIAGTVHNRIIAGISMSALQFSALGIGAITAYVVQLFPTTLRGTAVGAVLMCGRVGSGLGAAVAGSLLATACSTTFYLFSAILLLCAVLSFMLPKS